MKKRLVLEYWSCKDCRTLNSQYFSCCSECGKPKEQTNVISNQTTSPSKGEPEI